MRRRHDAAGWGGWLAGRFAGLSRRATYYCTYAANLDHVHGAVEVCAGAVHLIDEAHAGNAVLVRLPNTNGRVTVVVSAAKGTAMAGDMSSKGKRVPSKVLGPSVPH